MNSTEIEKVLSKIIDMDASSQAVEEATEALKVEKEKAIKKEMREVDLEMMKQARQLGKIERELILKEANEEIESINLESQRICQQMQEISDHHLNKLVEDVFQELIGKKIKTRR